MQPRMIIEEWTTDRGDGKVSVIPVTPHTETAAIGEKCQKGSDVLTNFRTNAYGKKCNEENTAERVRH